MASCGRHGAAPPLRSGRGRCWRHLSRPREGSQVSVGSSARVRRTKVIRPAEALQFRPVRAAGEGWPLKRKGGGPDGGPQMQLGAGGRREEWGGGGTSGYRWRERTLRPKGRCSFGPQTSTFSLGFFLLYPSLKNSRFLRL